MKRKNKPHQGKTRRKSKVLRGANLSNSEQFSKTIREKLGHYVYRLVDPRTEETFYVGKGQGNRLFQHARGAQKPTKNEDEFDLKTELIRDIQEAGFSVMAIIHRHGLDKKTAFEVEAALIEAYPDLANAQSGHGSSARGCKTVEQVKALYDARVANFKNINAVIIKIRQETIDAKGSVYNAVRSAWKVNLNRVEGLLVVASVGGIVKGVFTDVVWHKSASIPGRFEFSAKESTEKKHQTLLGCRLPAKFSQKGQAFPIRYT